MHQGPVSLFVLIHVNKDVIHVYCDPPFSKFLGEDGIYHGLKGGREVGEAEEHHFQFE